MYIDLSTGDTVDDQDAFEYVKEKVEQSPELMEEFENAAVDWFFSGGMWKKEMEDF